MQTALNWRVTHRVLTGHVIEFVAGHGIDVLVQLVTYLSDGVIEHLVFIAKPVITRTKPHQESTSS